MSTNSDDRPDHDRTPSAMRLSLFGLAITDLVRRHPRRRVTEVLHHVESSGIGVVWFGESVGNETLTTSGVLLADSRDLIVAPGIANIAARAPAAMGAGRRILLDAFPGRFMLGLGSSHESIVRAYGAEPDSAPVAALRTYIDAMFDTPGGVGDRAIPITIAALGPRMLELAVEYGFGVHPWNVTADRLAWIRSEVGETTLLAPRQAIMLCDDADIARRAGREHLAKYLAFPNYQRNWLRQGFDPTDLADGGSDRLIDAMVAWGSPERVARRLAAVIDAGADHVGVHPLSRPHESADSTIVEAATFLRDLTTERAPHR